MMIDILTDKQTSYLIDVFFLFALFSYALGQFLSVTLIQERYCVGLVQEDE